MKIRQDPEGTLGEINLDHRPSFNSTTSAFIRRLNDCVVFELKIHKVQGEMLSLLLPPQFLSDTGIKTDSEVQVDFQLAFDRTHYVNLHEAVDYLSSEIVSQRLIAKPRHSKACDIDLRRMVCIQSNLNNEQQTAVQQIVCQRGTLPVIVNGPFGTGKTHLLAEAVRILLGLSTGCRRRILICTQSNHAADLYVTKVDDFIQQQSRPTVHLHRIYYKHYNPNRIDPNIFKVVRRHCKFENNQFIMPDKKTLEKSDRLVVITTLVTSMQLRKLELPRRFFTHIFIDEAAQATEPETIAALGFASDRTCVVMAGDHKQVCLVIIYTCLVIIFLYCL